MVARLREQQTLDALDQLVTHLEGLRPERKFVMVFTEGWALYQRDERLARPLEDQVPGQDPLRVDPLTGNIAKPGAPDSARGQITSYQTCERQRAMLADIDHLTFFRTLLQRANRANVSFYPIDARGLIVFDQPISAGCAAWTLTRRCCAGATRISTTWRRRPTASPCSTPPTTLPAP